ncbi:PREDICTED: F-box protein At5g07610-like [Lupinus angustifolius]|uniref:F-box protein At5g07610-like n=1 Tax=Lupinus angustifolius TaxID=3871 RepID=UPI00092F388A|nr:PREDICTED: F-box protein At5g07610-like [Lupinus angustifolius]
MATIVASLEYLVSEILLRLPVKSVLRFKCVSKQWLALISEPKFCHSHTLRLYRTSRVFPSAILLAPGDSPTCQIFPLKSIKASDSSEFHNVKVPIGTVIQSCNGLLLIERSTSEDSLEVEYFVSNPTTNKSVPVIFPTQEFSSSVISLFICFEPLKSLHYKLVSIRVKNYKPQIDPDYVITVFSSETSSWSEPDFTFTPPHFKLPIQTNTVYFNGSLYWHSDNLGKIFYFDVDSQIFKTCPMPLNVKENGVSKFCESSGHSDFVLYIMELNEENSEWKLDFDVVVATWYNLLKNQSLYRLGPSI